MIDNTYQSRFWKITTFFSLLFIPISLLAMWIEGEPKSFFEVTSIIILALILLSVSQKQTLALSVGSINHEVKLKIYYPFFKIKRHAIPIDSLTITYRQEHIARGKYAKVIRLKNNSNNEEYKLSGQLLWWDELVLDQIMSELNELRKK